MLEVEMRKNNLIILFLFLLFLLTACVTDPNPAPVGNGDTDMSGSVYLLAINDTHGAFYSEGNYPGLDRVAGLLEELEEKNGKYVKIAVGDIFQGSYISNIHYGLPLLRALNAMEFDAFVIGNHEFDWGLDKIARYADGDPENGEADFPFLAANIVCEGKKLDWTEDYVIVEREGFKIGIIGVIGYGLESSIAADKVEGYAFLDPVPIVRDLAAELRSEHSCDIVIVANHDYSLNFYLNVAAFPEESYVDAVICGHTHQLVNKKEMREDEFFMPVIQSDDKNETAGEIAFKFNKEGKLYSATARHYEPSRYQAGAAVAALVEEYASDIAAGERVVGYTPEILYKPQIGEEMVFAMASKYQADVAIINTGGVREILARGPIRVKDVYEVFPFDNAVILTDIGGWQLKELYDEQKQFLYLSEFDFDDIDEYETYRVAIIDYVYNQSYYRDYFTGFEPEETHDLMRDIFIEFLEEFYQ